MKKFFTLCLALLFVLSGCSKNASVVSLENLPADYSIDDAKRDKCVVFENRDITSGQSVWDAFIRAKDDGENATVRLAYYYTIEDPSHYSEEYYNKIKDDYPVLYLKELTANGDGFVLTGFEDGEKITKEYKYLVRYEGEPSSPYAVFSHYTYYVLVNDETVTWEEIEYGMYSSQSGDLIDHYSVYSDLVYK